MEKLTILYNRCSDEDKELFEEVIVEVASLERKLDIAEENLAYFKERAR